MWTRKRKKSAHGNKKEHDAIIKYFSFWLFGLICFSLVLLPNAPSISCSLVFSFNYVLIVGYEHCPNGPCEFPFFVCSSLIPLVAVTKTTISKLLGTTLAVHVATSDKSVVKLKKKRKENEDDENYVGQLPDRRRRHCRRPSDSPPSRVHRGQWLDPGRKEWCRRHRMLRRTRLPTEFKKIH